uniref:Uncharacterized protein n=1 Tax=Opuntia streptacantha TaxID=393608 RepID=A0A7C9E8S4_OPUST
MIWSSNGGFSIDLHLIRRSVRSCWLHPSDYSSLMVAGCPDVSPAVNLKPLDVFPEAAVDGMDEEENVDLFLNLHTLEDIDMSADSSKRKRCEEGEEVSSRAALP